ncbi:MAG: NAD(P)-dependent oxidoreductase [Candidatus Latescibacterota bacterium]|nr:NAD(P)-dependent oxidoreductase [Candidatus Latescibacterota bacterium]
MRRLSVLLLPLEQLRSPWCDDVVSTVGDRHDIRLLDKTQAVGPQFAGVDVVIDQGGSVGTRQMMDAATDTRLWQILGTGFDHFDLDYIKARNILVANCPGQFSSTALAETAMMFILMLAHRYRAVHRNFRDGVLYEPMGVELSGQTLGILGFGASGRELAIRAKACGMRIVATDAVPIEPDVLEQIQPDFVGTPGDTDTVVSQSDYLSLHLHLNEETTHLIDERLLALMKPTACLINVARGALVDEDALYRVLMDDKIGGAGLDVFSREPPDVNHPVFELPQVVSTPHIAGCTDGTSRKRAACAAQNVDRIAEGLEPLYRIDL